MTSEYIEKFIECEFQRVTTIDSDCSISDGAMGVALFMIWYGQHKNKTKYIDDGLHIIESRCLNLSANDPLDLHKGQVVASHKAMGNSTAIHQATPPRYNSLRVPFGKQIRELPYKRKEG